MLFIIIEVCIDMLICIYIFFLFLIKCFVVNFVFIEYICYFLKKKRDL